jgi:hypothetical protein
MGVKYKDIWSQCGAPTVMMVSVSSASSARKRSSVACWALPSSETSVCLAVGAAGGRRGLGWARFNVRVVGWLVGWVGWGGGWLFARWGSSGVYAGGVEQVAQVLGG